MVTWKAQRPQEKVSNGLSWFRGGPVATWKGFGRARVGSGAAGDPDLGPTWVQLETSWRQLGATMGST